MMNALIYPKRNPAYYHNRGCGMCYLQRSKKVPFFDVPDESWFLKEGLTDKISIEVPWCLIEPEEGRYEWNHSEWEGCFKSWIDAGFKVNLKIRAMDTLGTFYNAGVPQWVFDAGAKYVDDPISLYRRDVTQLDGNIPLAGKLPVRYPVYWDPVFIEKSERLIHEMGKRYNGNPAIESVAVAHMGRWGEMHIGDWGPMEPWIEAGFTMDTYIKTAIRFIDIYRAAFPDTPLSIEIHRAALYPEYHWADVMEVFDYAAEKGVMLKYDGLGASFEPGSTPYLCKSVAEIFRKYRHKTKLQFENLVLPEALDEAVSYGISYWCRGGESDGVAIAKVAEDIPIKDKRIFSWYYSFPERYDLMTIEQQKDCFRKMARKCGYLLTLDSLALAENPAAGKTVPVVFNWNNIGYAACYEKFHVELALFDQRRGNYIWRQEQYLKNSGNPVLWDAGKQIDTEIPFTFPADLPSGDYELQMGVRFDGYNHEMMQLALAGRTIDGRYPVGTMKI